MARILYALIIFLLIPAIMARLVFRALKQPGYAKRWHERLGFVTPCVKKNVIWLHTVSVGETLAAVPLVKALQKQYPNFHLNITCMTPTGSERIQAVFGNSVEHSYAPYDTPDAVARFLNSVKPVMLIIMETELWPNTIAACQKRKIPVILANARLSEKSARGYKRILPLVRPMLRSINSVIAQHKDDGARFVELGLPKAALTIGGNIKFDLSLNSDLQLQAISLKESWRGNSNRPILLAASTHDGEDEIILNGFNKIIASSEVMPLLVLVPRHPERFSRVEELCKSEGYVVAKRTQCEQDISKADILLGDTMGELMLFYGACDIAFVGGSMVPTGGHNMIEPATWGVPVISGPHLFNFSEASQLLLEGNAMVLCQDADSLAKQVLKLLQDDKLRNTMGESGRRITQQNRGALDILLTQIKKQLAQ